MRAVGFKEFGGPEVLHVLELVEPHPGPGEVRVRVRAATVNPFDVGMRAGAFRHMLRGVRPPYVGGWDAAGVVDAVGEGVTAWRVGDEVMAIRLPVGAHGGTHMEQIVVPERSVARMPAGTDFVAACTVPSNGLTARQTLDRLALRPGQTLAVTGAAGIYGGYVIQLAKVAGLRVVADAAPADEELVRGLGADVVVARGTDVAVRVRAAVPEGVDAVADGAVLGSRMLPALRDGGHLAAVQPFDGTPERGITVHQVSVSEDVEEQEKLDELRDLVERGAVTPRVADTYPMEDAAEAHRRLEAGGVRGRLVLRF